MNAIELKKVELLDLVAESRVVWAKFQDALCKEEELVDRYNDTLRQIGDRLLAGRTVLAQVKVLRKTKDALVGLEPEVRELASKRRAINRGCKKATLAIKAMREAVSA